MVLFTLSLAQNCTQLLGMQSRNISDGQISASSERKVYLGPTNARLNFSGTDVRLGAWMPGRNDHNQWLQVDFGNETKVTGIDTQGRRCGNCSHWVKKYNVTYGQDNATFHQYKENGRVKVSRQNSGFPKQLSSDLSWLFFFLHYIEGIPGQHGPRLYRPSRVEPPRCGAVRPHQPYRVEQSHRPEGGVPRMQSRYTGSLTRPRTPSSVSLLVAW